MLTLEDRVKLLEDEMVIASGLIARLAVVNVGEDTQNEMLDAFGRSATTLTKEFETNGL